MSYCPACFVWMLKCNVQTLKHGVWCLKCISATFCGFHTEMRLVQEGVHISCNLGWEEWALLESLPDDALDLMWVGSLCTHIWGRLKEFGGRLKIFSIIEGPLKTGCCAKDPYFPLIYRYGSLWGGLCAFALYMWHESPSNYVLYIS